MSTQERGRRRALESLHRHLSSKLPQYETTVAGLQAVVATLPTTGSDDTQPTLDVLMEGSKRLHSSVEQLRAIVPK